MPGTAKHWIQLGIRRFSGQTAGNPSARAWPAPSAPLFPPGRETSPENFILIPGGNGRHMVRRGHIWKGLFQCRSVQPVADNNFPCNLPVSSGQGFNLIADMTTLISSSMLVISSASWFYIVVYRDDPLAAKEIPHEKDLAGQTFMIGGDSPSEMAVVQNRIAGSGHVRVRNCPDHKTAMTNVAARRGIVLSPWFTNDYNGEFVWIPFDCSEHIRCVLGYHRDDARESARFFIELVQTAYTHADVILL